jgi:hypothetical protein
MVKCAKSKGILKGFTRGTVKISRVVYESPNVVESPIVNETILVKNIATGQKERVNKLLLQISIRELHNDMLLPPDQGGFAEAWDERGAARISDTALRGP